MLPVLVLECVLYFISVWKANTQAEKIMARMIQVRIETKEQHEDMYSSCEEHEVDALDGPSTKINKLNSKASMTTKMLNQAQS